jgi:holo-[acyl-carrier protein] synthase
LTIVAVFADVRVGTDIESVADVASSLTRYGDRYTRRLFTEAEVRACGPRVESAAPRYAARFAAKEAVLKLLAPTDTIPPWRSIEVRSEPGGAPSIVLHDEAAELARRRGVTHIALSLSHAAGVGLATAVALISGDQRKDTNDTHYG